jgi:hypothetical protein
MSSFAVYKNEVFRMSFFNEKIEIYSELKKLVTDDFIEQKINQGFISKVLYVKEVTVDELDMAYKLDYKVVYKGKEFVPISSIDFTLNTNNVIVYTHDPVEAEQLGFDKKEQFVYERHVPISEIDVMIEIKKPILKFEHLNIVESKIEQKDILNHLKNLVR